MSTVLPLPVGALDISVVAHVGVLVAMIAAGVALAPRRLDTLLRP